MWQNWSFYNHWHKMLYVQGLLQVFQKFPKQMGHRLDLRHLYNNFKNFFEVRYVEAAVTKVFDESFPWMKTLRKKT